ncbi:MAG: hypothetical protein B0D92_07350 [Spirochaeta sp. LUC14_002_19_P3]|nr:MAG: hypothetical protein B0D92_07350 [Spirochaeta sp. LUC14_002_19_P3]
MPSYRIIKAIVAAVLLHIGFAGYRLLPVLGDFHPIGFLLPMGELMLVFVLLSPGTSRKTTTAAALALLSFLVFFGVGEIFYRLIYMEHFSPIYDMQLIPNFFVMMLQRTGLPAVPIRIASVIITLAALLASAYALLILIRETSRIFLGSRKMKILVSALALLFILVAPPFSPSAQTLAALLHKPEAPALSAPPPVEEPTQEWNFAAIEDSSIHFVVVESYGAALFQKQEYIPLMSGVYADLQRLLDEHELAVKSGFVRSPAFGGRSWLADATILTGVQIENQKIYDARVADGERAWWLELMQRSGYTCYYVAPGTSQADAQWRYAYPFDVYLLQNDFQYEGPPISFGLTTDQYLLHEFAANYLQNDMKQFAFYLLVSAHTPFDRIPVYKEDWQFPLKGREYADGYVRYFENNWLHGNELAEGYIEGMSYSLTSTIHYLTDKVSGKKFMLIIGDHQPRIPVSGPNPGYPVIFHIIYSQEFHLAFPDSWTLSNALVPPTLPANYQDIPEMAAIPSLIEKIIR